MNIIVRLADGSVDTFTDSDWKEEPNYASVVYCSAGHSFEVDSQNSLTVTKYVVKGSASSTTVVGYYRPDQYTTVRENS